MNNIAPKEPSYAAIHGRFTIIKFDAGCLQSEAERMENSGKLSEEEMRELRRGIDALLSQVTQEDRLCKMVMRRITSPEPNIQDMVTSLKDMHARTEQLAERGEELIAQMQNLITERLAAK